MFLRELFEAERKTAVFAFGRMNPPTVGHKKLADKVSSLPGDGYIFLSHTQKPGTDPLNFQTKLQFAQSMFPNVKVGDPEVRTIIQALKKLQSLGYTDIIYVAGSDRVKDFEALINKYNGVEYQFGTIRVENAGQRDPDAEGADGMSASKMRAAAMAGDFKTFSMGVPSTFLAKPMYLAVRSGLGVQEDIVEDAGQVTPDLLKKLEMYLDKLFATLRIDVEFTRHFLDRVNDERNVRQITIQELAKLFRDAYSKYGKKIAQMGPNAQAVIKDMSTDINVPFVLNWDPRRQELDLVAKTVMRKKNFATPNPELVI